MQSEKTILIIWACQILTGLALSPRRSQVHSSRPGGRIVIIDKNAEKWFGRKELEKLLGRHCAKVSSRPISYWEDVAPDGLFLAWLAER